jgi:4-diphosphocytidyl-2-C-methyl-D-erythritol kinase
MKAFAKLNLFLHIVGRRPDGYHNLSSLVVFLKDLYDEIVIEESDRAEVLFTGLWNKNIPSENTVTRALALMQEYLPKQFKVVVTKNIPSGAGLGGGSSDAACVIQYINKKYMLNLENSLLIKLCLSIGADVPMFLQGDALYMSGLGEVTTLLTKQLPALVALLVYPNKPVNSAQVYKMKRDIIYENISLPASFNSTTQLIQFLKGTRNDLYTSSVQLLPELDLLINELIRLPGCLLARMTGSGSACFALFINTKIARLALNTLQKKFPLYSTYLSTAQ